MLLAGRSDVAPAQRMNTKPSPSPILAPAGAAFPVPPQAVLVEIDASDVPADYILSILSQCSTFPEVLVFFLKGRLTARVLFQRQRLPPIDTYFMVDCRDGGTVPSHEPPSPSPALAALAAAVRARRAAGDGGTGALR